MNQANWAVYADGNTVFFKTEEEARDHISKLISDCEQQSVDLEKDLYWDITLLEAQGECHWTQDGLTLEIK